MNRSFTATINMMVRWPRLVSAPPLVSSGPGSSACRGHYILLCSWARLVLLSIKVYKWVPATVMQEHNPGIDLYPIPVAGKI